MHDRAWRRWGAGGLPGGAAMSWQCAERGDVNGEKRSRRCNAASDLRGGHRQKLRYQRYCSTTWFACDAEAVREAFLLAVVAQATFVLDEILMDRSNADMQC